MSTDAMRGMFQGSWSIRGRDSSTTFAKWLGILLLANLVLSGLPVIGFLATFVLSWFGWTASVRRGHDMGRSAWSTFAIVVLPQIVMFGAAFFLLFAYMIGTFRDGAATAFVLCFAAFMLATFAPVMWYLSANGMAATNAYGPDPRTEKDIVFDPLRLYDARIGRMSAIAILAVYLVIMAVTIVLVASA